MRFLLSSMLCLALVATIPVAAQTTAELSGTVTDPSGVAIGKVGSERESDGRAILRSFLYPVNDD